MTTTITRAPATRPAVLGLDDRLALTGLAMDQRLDQAAVAFEVNTAHIPAEQLPEITIPQPPQTAVPAPYTTPLAALLHRARIRLQTDGWTTGALRDEQGSRCALGAIRGEAQGDRGAEADASTVLLEAIRRRFPGADSVPSWNDSQRDSGPVMRLLDEAAALADSRGI
jgi:hypothetical protein